MEIDHLPGAGSWCATRRSRTGSAARASGRHLIDVIERVPLSEVAYLDHWGAPLS
ncbi:hypothetical protein [Amycolatopsis lexingtonensis]|uniref:hypothetical protein n=1 Tax=Amycolatopsis lexingtonensis TaxID=218822 RepID=UPI003F6EB833